MKVHLSYLDYQQDVFFNWKPGIKYKIIPKGRRSGITKGGCNWVIEELADHQGPILWGDTIHGNIDRYFQRYIQPELKVNRIRHHWESQRKQLTINGHFCDFRSADNPENWEGFGYKKIFLNEAGIILKNRELYTNTVLPMLLDYPESKLIAAGVPKGKVLKDGNEHPFYTLHKRAQENPGRYESRTFTSYDNPILDRVTIAELEEEIASISPNAIAQEIYGEFIESDALNPFAYQWDDYYHMGEQAIFQSSKRLYLSIDFNLNPFAITFWHFWQDSAGVHLHGIEEADIPSGNVPKMIELIRKKYSSVLHSAVITGDAMGNQQNIARRDNASHYIEIMRNLGLSENQIQVPANPTHENSRTEVNKFLWLCKSKDSRFHFRLHPVGMKKTAQDFRIVQCDANDSIVKRNRKDLSQRADYLDTARYIINLLIRTGQIRLN